VTAKKTPIHPPVFPLRFGGCKNPLFWIRFCAGRGIRWRGGVEAAFS